MSCNFNATQFYILISIYHKSTDLPTSSAVQWSGLQNLFGNAESDVLVLLDCCAAACSVSGTGSGATEVLAACGFETSAPGVEEHSFTRAVVDELRYWGQNNALSVAMLHNKVLSRIKVWKPRFGTSGEEEKRRTPMYIFIADEQKKRSIVLTPLRRVEPMDLGPDATLTSSQSSSELSSQSPEDVEEATQDSSQSSLDQIWPDKDFRNPKVLISVALQDDQWLSTSDWTEWLRSISALVKYAHVEGIYKSDSALMLVSILVAIWDLIPKNTAIRFIGFK